MWRQFFLDHTFWSTIAVASTVLLIAVALEVRTAREEMQRESASRKDDRVANLLTALWGLAIALVGSLVIASLDAFPGDVVAAIGSLITVIAAAYGIWALIWAMSARLLHS